MLVSILFILRGFSTQSETDTETACFQIHFDPPPKGNTGYATEWWLTIDSRWKVRRKKVFVVRVYSHQASAAASPLVEGLHCFTRVIHTKR